MNAYKIIIFDLDGTLYDLNDVVSMNYDIQFKFLKQNTSLNNDEISNLFQSNNIYKEKRISSKSCTELFIRMGFDKNKWNKFREANFNVNHININNCVKEESIIDLKKQYSVILLSSNSINNINRILKHININSQLFNEIICSDCNALKNNFNKKDAMEYIEHKYKCETCNMLSIGDRYETDIKPCISIGGDGILIKKPTNIVKIISDLKNNSILTCGEYSFYKGK